MPRADNREVLLGDVGQIGSHLVQYDFGKQYPDGFVRKNTVYDDLSSSNRDLRGLLAIFQTERGRKQLQRTAVFLKQLQTKALQKKYRVGYSYPGAAEDKLFESSYRHKHHVSPTCVCRDCHGRLDPVCDEIFDKSCNELGCDESYLVRRERVVMKLQPEEDNGDEQQPMIHIGLIASGDKVMKSGEDRDAVATKEGIIAFEMEGAGVWEEIPCLVVKGVCDYADSHKNKKVSGLHDIHDFSRVLRTRLMYWEVAGFRSSNSCFGVEGHFGTVHSNGQGPEARDFEVRVSLDGSVRTQ